MRTHIVKPLRLLLVASLWVAAPAAQSAMYRWVDENGSVTYSNQLPSSPDAGDVSVIDERTDSLTASEKRTLEILNEARETASKADTARDALAAPGALNEASAKPDEGDDAPISVRSGMASKRPEAVRDPCLTSADPKCPEKYRAYYVPGVGYSPSTVRAAREADASGVGATVGSLAGGTLTGGAAPPPQHLTPPKSSIYALPPGSDAGPNRKP